MKYMVNSSKLAKFAAKLNEKIKNLEKINHERFCKENNYTFESPLNDEDILLIQQVEMGQINKESLPASLFEKIGKINEEAKSTIEKVENGEYDVYLFTEEEVVELLSISENDIKSILDGKETESIPES